MNKLILASAILMALPALATFDDHCESKAIESATVFQNLIVSEMVVDPEYTTIESSKKITDSSGEELMEFLVNTTNNNGTRMRDTAVVTDVNCNVQSVSRR